MNFQNPYAPPDVTTKSYQSASLSVLITVRILDLAAIVLGLVFACYGFVVAFEFMNRGRNVLPPAWPYLNIVGISAAVGLVIAIVGSREFSRGRSILLRAIAVFLVLAVIAVIAMSIDKLCHLGSQQQTKQR